MRIFSFAQFITEGFSIGAGVTFTGSCSLTAAYELSSNNARNTRADARAGKFSADGFGVTFPDASSWLIHVDTTPVKQVKREVLKKIKIPECAAQICKKLGLPDGEFGTVGDLLRANPDAVLNVKVTAGYNYKQVHFKGYSRGKFLREQPVMEEVEGLDDGYTAIFVEGISAPGNESIVMELAPTLHATGRFTEFFDEVFNEKGKNDFVRDEIRSMVTGGKLLEEITELINTAAGYDGWTPDKFVREVNKGKDALDDLVSFMADREPMSEIDARWSTSLKEEYSATTDPVA